MIAVTIAFNAQSTAPPTIRPIPLPKAPGCACSPDAIETMVRIKDAAPAAMSTMPAKTVMENMVFKNFCIEVFPLISQYAGQTVASMHVII